jgi:hypothetical protein
LVVVELAESSNIGISIRGINYHNEVRVVRMWLDIYSDHGEYI